MLRRLKGKPIPSRIAASIRPISHLDHSRSTTASNQQYWSAPMSELLPAPDSTMLLRLLLQGRLGPVAMHPIPNQRRGSLKKLSPTLEENKNHIFRLFQRWILFKQWLRDEIVYLHSLWHQGPPPNPLFSAQFASRAIPISNPNPFEKQNSAATKKKKHKNSEEPKEPEKNDYARKNPSLSPLPVLAKRHAPPPPRSKRRSPGR
ncbi:Protein kinase domain-containing protein [Psidium guajava]|nr:Protein kinase domain-containing protein [Psidium guajava]